MRTITFYFFLVSCLFGSNSVILPQGKTGVATFPSLTNGQSFRLEGEIHARTPIAGQYAYAIQLGSIQNSFLVSWGAGQNDVLGCIVQNAPVFQNTGIPAHFEFRMQRIVTVPGVSATKTCEIWDKAATGAPLVYSNVLSMVPSAIPSGSLTLGHPGANFALAKLKFFSTTVPAGGPAPSSVSSTGDWGNYLFEGSTAAQLGDDTSPANRDLTWSGGTAPGTVTTPVLAPVCNAGTFAGQPAGGVMTFSGAASWARNDDAGPLSYSWQIVSEPPGSQAVIVGNSVSSLFRIQNLIFGEYTVGLTVSSDGLVSTCTNMNTAIPQTPGGVVLYPGLSYAQKVLLGRIMVWGRNPVQWADYAVKRAADEIISLYDKVTNYDRKGYWDGDSQNWGPGTVTVIENSSSVTCSVAGTCTFRSNICNSSGVVLPAGGQGYIMINVPAYNAGVPVSPPENAWMYSRVLSCPTDNDLTLASLVDVGAANGAVIPIRNWSYTSGILNSAIQAYSAAQPSAIDFYDVGLAYRRLYYATGISTYKYWADKLAERLYSNPVNMNRGLMYSCPTCSRNVYYASTGSPQEPRDINMINVVLRAMDDKPEYWVGLRRICEYLAEWIVPDTRAMGNREEFYALAFVSACALGDPDSTKRAHWVSEVNRILAHFDAWRCGNGNFDCHGRHRGQWVRDQYSAGGSGFGAQSVSPFPGVARPNWKAYPTSGSTTVTFTVNGSPVEALTYASNHPKYPNQPILFGPDPDDATVCTGISVTTNNFACAEGTRSLAQGQMVKFISPVTTTGATTLAYTGTAMNIRDYAGTLVQPLYAGYTYVLWLSDNTLRVLQPISDSTNLGKSRLVLNMRCSDNASAIGYYWPHRVNGSTVVLKEFSTSLNRSVVNDVTWPGASFPSGCDFQIDAGVWIGNVTQPFMMGIALKALAYAYGATVNAGSPNTLALTLLSDAAKWIVDYGYDSVTEGLYYGRTSPGCEQPLATYGRMFKFIPRNPGCTYDLANSNTARGLSPEIFGGMAAAYLLETNATRKANIKSLMTRMYAKTFGKPGYACAGDYAQYCGDGYYNAELEAVYTVGQINYHVDKYVGFNEGFAGASALPASLLLGQYP